jgi:hypothetical protein
VVVDDFNVIGVAVSPKKADPPLIVNPNTILSFAISGKALEAVAGWDSKIIEAAGIVDLHQFSVRHFHDVVRNAFDKAALPGGLSGSVLKRLDYAGPILS